MTQSLLLTSEEESRLLPDEKLRYLNILRARVHKIETIEEWNQRRFPTTPFLPLAPHQEDYWNWIRSLRRREPVASSHVACWARGGGKTTTVTRGFAYVADHLTRDYCLIVCNEQSKADEMIVNLAKLMEQMGVKPAVSRERQQRGWTHNTLRASNGFNAAGFGYDTTIRGSLFDFVRPDWIHLDDIHSLKDSIQMLEKKRDILTKSVLPALAAYGAVSFTQNKIDENSEMARMIDGRADYLLDRNKVVEIPALYNAEYESVMEGTTKKWFIMSGTPSWEGQGIAECQQLLNKIGYESFRTECQHETGLEIANQRFDNEKLQSVKNEILAGLHEPLSESRARRELKSFPELTELLDDKSLMVWREYVPGDAYCVSVDCAEGMDFRGENDFCAVQVMNANTWEQVARIQGKWEAVEFAPIIHAIAIYYGGKKDCLLVVLRKAGLSVLSYLIHDPDKQWTARRNREWGGLYYHNNAEIIETRKRDSQETMKPGYNEDPGTKVVMITALSDAIKEETVLLHDLVTVNEGITYIKWPQGRTGGKSGAKDDTISSLAVNILMLLMRYDRRVRAREEEEVEDKWEQPESKTSVKWNSRGRR